MAITLIYLFVFFHVCFFFVSASLSDFSILDYNFDSDPFKADYAPPSPPPPSPPPHPPSLTCHELQGIGSLNTTCQLNYNVNFTRDVYLEGTGNLFILQGVLLSCQVPSCSITINITGNLKLKANARILAGSVYIVAGNASFISGSLINVTGLAGDPPEQSTGTPKDYQGGGGGHGGRGASCVMDNKKLPEDVWGGDTYSWKSLEQPFSYGSKGQSTNKEDNYGGNGGGKIWLDVNNVFDACGTLLADGGDAGIKGGGGSGGSIYIKSKKMIGGGKISASGGNGFAGGGGGRVSVEVFSRHDDSEFFVHGGSSFGCPTNAGAAGTFYDAVPRRLIVNNHNLSTDTDTLLFEFPNHPLWTNIYIQDHARATVPLLWSRLQVRGQLSLSHGAILSFGLVHYALSEFELLAEELLMSDSVIKIYGSLRMSVKIQLMLNSKMLIDGDGDAIVATSLLEMSNLVVLKGSSVIQSNANLGVHGQGSLNLTGPGDIIEAQHLVLSLFYSINVGPGSILRGPLENAGVNHTKARLFCGQANCPIELIYPPEDCNVNSSLSFTLQVCRVEDVLVEGFLEGSVVHFHLVRTVIVKSTGSISVSGLGCTGGLGSGVLLPNGLSSGAGHGGKGGDAFYNGSYIRGGISYGDTGLPCELGSGSGNHSLPSSTAGGGIIVMGSLEHSLIRLSVYGSIQADGESFGKYSTDDYSKVLSDLGPGGGSGGTILLFVQSLVLGDSSTISTMGGHGSPNGGGGGGGRIHFHWSDISVGDEYLPITSVKGTINVGYEDAFNRFVDEINELASYQWWEGSVYGILCTFAYPLAWSWLQWRRKKKMQQLREFVRSEYDHACLRSCRSRALYEGLKVAATSDLMLAYVDFFLGGDEKRDDLPPPLHQRLPMSIRFGGDGSYMSPFSLQSDNILTSLMSQSVPPTIWYRLVAGLNAQLRLVHRGHLRANFCPVISWLETHANPYLRAHGIHVYLTHSQPSASGHDQFGLLVCTVGNEPVMPSESQNRSLLLEKHPRTPANRWRKAFDLVRVNEHATVQKKIPGEILHDKNLQALKDQLTLCYPFYYIIRNTRPVGHQDVIGLVISILLLGDFSLVLLTLLQLYSISMLDVFFFLSILPLGILLPFPAGINALFSHGPARSAVPARVYALWNIISTINVVVAFICGFVHFHSQSSAKRHPNFQSWKFSMDDSGWWMLPTGLLLFKTAQASLINYHVANLEIQDRTLYSNDPDVFWRS
ncbi:uncharacterized protein LOC125866815 isoform X3 [Solanum stenotomum]|uniref:uncharacterized protein LOC125866815 isoform X3 n=1 Tax=Solanum stenotomum TaxID=172797 RepID=UPI0020D12C2B|nr:uncharacterized protein LOC125866815 isoform X3 [Solanum stenotomum]